MNILKPTALKLWRFCREKEGPAQQKTLGIDLMRCYCDTSVLIAAHTMADTRCFNLPSITRNELMSLTEECAKLTGIPYVMDAYLDEAMEILNS